MPIFKDKVQKTEALKGTHADAATSTGSMSEEEANAILDDAARDIKNPEHGKGASQTPEEFLANRQRITPPR